MVRLTKPIVQMPIQMDWNQIDPELFRGPGLSFPTKIKFCVAPTFTGSVIKAANDFNAIYRHSFLDPDPLSTEAWPSEITNIITPQDPKIKPVVLRSYDLGVYLTYICGGERILIFGLDPISLDKYVTKH